MPQPGFTMHRGPHSGWLAALVVAAVGVAIQWPRVPAIFTSSGVLFVDPDDHMRLVRVQSILEGGPRIIRFTENVNWPNGLAMHWTAPFDYLLVGANAVFGGLSSASDRLAGTAAWVPVWMGMAYSLVMMAMIRRVCGWGPALIAGAMIVLSPSYHRVFQLGHPDHHCLLELLFAIAVAAWVPNSGGDVRRIPSRVAVMIGGAAIGLAIWIAPQALPVWAAILAGATLATFRAAPNDRAAWTARRTVWNFVVLAVVLCGYGIENGPSLGEVAIDKISLFHLALAFGALFVPSGDLMAVGSVTAMEAGRSNDRRVHAFIVRVGLFLMVAGGLFAWVIVDRGRIFRYSRSEELLRWWAIVVELQPLYTHAGGQWSLAPLHAHLGYTVYFLPVLLVFFVRCKTVPAGAKLTLTLLALGMTALTIYQRRWIDHVNLGLVPVTVIGTWAFVCAIVKDGGPTAWRAMPGVARMVAMMVLLAMIYPSAAASVLTGPTPSPDAQNVRTALIADRINAWEAAHSSADSPRRAILCDEGCGPMLLYRTRLPVVSAPYHRGTSGIVAAGRFYAERDPAEARRMVDRLGVRYVVVPFRPHEQLINFEQVAYGELRSYDPPEQGVDDEGNIRKRLHYRPQIAETSAYRLTLQGGGGIPGLELVESIVEGATTPDGKSGLLYVVKDLPGDAR